MSLARFAGENAMKSSFRSAYLAAAFLAIAVSAAPAQTFYEPVTVQHRSPSQALYFYGGHDARMFAWIDSLDCRYVNQNPQVTPIPVSPLVRVFTDCLPMASAEDRGYTSSDAMNEANANVPLFFRMRDAVAPVRETRDGVMVPAYARPIAPTDGPATRPATQGTILIIPKSLLRPAPKPAATPVATAGN
jgi:hypothetical protein